MRVAVGRTQGEGAVAGRARGDAATEARVIALLTRHEASLMRVARQWSICQDDAYDALQRGLEIYVRRIATIDRATEAAWLKVVIRHEALAIRRARGEAISAEVDLDTHVAAEDRSVEEQVLGSDRVSRSAEALRGLKPDEARALMLKAHGLSYEEIARRCGWTYTKVNRAITEGRRRFLALYGSLEAGEECERFAPILHALAAGRATSDQLVEVRPHLRRCQACRATVRDLHLSGVRRLRLLSLPALVVPLRWLHEHV
jgi:RNA polymerase sigma factor (sigma-70 family)